MIAPSSIDVDPLLRSLRKKGGNIVLSSNFGDIQWYFDDASCRSNNTHHVPIASSPYSNWISWCSKKKSHTIPLPHRIVISRDTLPVNVDTGLVLLDGKLVVSSVANDVTETAESMVRLQERLLVDEDEEFFLLLSPSNRPKRVYKSVCEPFLSGV